MAVQTPRSWIDCPIYTTLHSEAHIKKYKHCFPKIGRNTFLNRQKLIICFNFFFNQHHSNLPVEFGLQQPDRKPHTQTPDFSTLTASPCVTRFHHPSHSLTVGSSFLTVLQILSGFFPKLSFLKKQTQAAHSNTAEESISSMINKNKTSNLELGTTVHEVSEDTYW